MGKVKTKKNNKGTVFLHSFLSVCGHRGDTVEGHSGLKAFFVGVHFPFLVFFQSFLWEWVYRCKAANLCWFEEKSLLASLLPPPGCHPHTSVISTSSLLFT